MSKENELETQGNEDFKVVWRDYLAYSEKLDELTALQKNLVNWIFGILILSPDRNSDSTLERRGQNDWIEYAEGMLDKFLLQNLNKKQISQVYVGIFQNLHFDLQLNLHS